MQWASKRSNLGKGLVFVDHQFLVIWFEGGERLVLNILGDFVPDFRPTKFDWIFWFFLEHSRQEVVLIRWSSCIVRVSVTVRTEIFIEVERAISIITPVHDFGNFKTPQVFYLQDTRLLVDGCRELESVVYFIFFVLLPCQKATNARSSVVV